MDGTDAQHGSMRGKERVGEEIDGKEGERVEQKDGRRRAEERSGSISMVRARVRVLHGDWLFLSLPHQ